MTDLWPMVVVLATLWAFTEILIITHERRDTMGNFFKKVWGLFGRNQWYQIFLHGGVILTSIVATYVSAAATVVDWFNFIQVYGLGAAGVTGVPSAIMKTAGIIANGRKPGDAPEDVRPPPRQEDISS